VVDEVELVAAGAVLVVGVAGAAGVLAGALVADGLLEPQAASNTTTIGTVITIGRMRGVLAIERSDPS
jgi:hypothetical protein